jgi:hypothetical protein
LNDTLAGEQSIREFEKWYTTGDEKRIEEDLVQEVYEEGYYCYIRLMLYKKAEKVLDAGARIFPENEFFTSEGREALIGLPVSTDRTFTPKTGSRGKALTELSRYLERYFLPQ